LGARRVVDRQGSGNLRRDGLRPTRRGYTTPSGSSAQALASRST
jgi:hypothetical protein